MMQPQPTLALPSYTSLGSLITEDMTSSEAVAAAYSADLDELGSGSFTTAFRSPRGERVLRLSRADMGAEVTLRACDECSDNPHLPRIYSRIYLADGGLAVECEALERVDWSTWDAWALKWRPEDYKAEQPHHHGIPCAMKAALTAIENAKSTLEAAGERLGWDAHSANIMARADGTLVLNDIVYDKLRFDGDSYGYDEGASDWSSEETARCECNHCRVARGETALPIAA